MKIVFGTYSIKLRSYEPSELGYNNDQLPETRFEIRQKVFHLFWIPVFPIGKIYGARKQGILVGVAPEQEKALRSKERVRTPWYSYSLVFVLLLGYLGYLGYEEYKSYDRKNRRETSFNNSIQQMDKDFNSLDTQCLLKLKKRFRNGLYKDGDYLKITSVEGDKITATLLETKFKDYEIPKVLAYYHDHQEELPTIHLTLDQIKAGICRDLSTYNNYTCPGVNLLQDENEYFIDEVIRY